ncbi:hypothetical protein [Aquimarina sp. 2201CG14-23]|uniref:hypothetical protein n=1 Tax=Aquimarina mycalae TaxID=3040073 RepID=UPI002477F30E|nr:hypothetical protein [Aquimarina sp. 2201CG14-23]MDH7447631.1 hypothetical protein [Aquimarina sp. 2201CG14-23]
MKLVTYTLMLFIVLNSKAQQMKEIGIGILEVNTNSDISFFKNFNDVTPAAILHIEQLKDLLVKYESPIVLNPYQISEGETDIEVQELLNSGLVPAGPILKFIVTEATSNYYKVIVDDKKGTKYYIKKSPEAMYYTTRKALEGSFNTEPSNRVWFLYETWEHYLKRVEYIELKKLEIYDKPYGEIIFCSETYDFYPFKVKSIKGEWIELIKDPLREFNFKKGTNYEGWYQWKTGNEWQIQIVEYTIE